MLVGNNDNELGITLAIPGSLGSLGGAANSTPPPEIIAIGNDIAFNCPAGEAAAARVKNGVNAWRYRYMRKKATFQALGLVLTLANQPFGTTLPSLLTLVLIIRARFPLSLAPPNRNQLQRKTCRKKRS